MNPSLRDEYETIRTLITDGKNTADQLKETLSRIKVASPGLSKEDKRLLHLAIYWTAGAKECFDIILEDVDQVTTKTPIFKGTTQWRK